MQCTVLLSGTSTRQTQTFIKGTRTGRAGSDTAANAADVANAVHLFNALRRDRTPSCECGAVTERCDGDLDGVTVPGYRCTKPHCGFWSPLRAMPTAPLMEFCTCATAGMAGTAGAAGVHLSEPTELHMAAGGAALRRYELCSVCHTPLRLAPEVEPATEVEARVGAESEGNDHACA